MLQLIMKEPDSLCALRGPCVAPVKNKQTKANISTRNSSTQVFDHAGLQEIELGCKHSESKRQLQTLER
jgi:hypothetical protein